MYKQVHMLPFLGDLTVQKNFNDAFSWIITVFLDDGEMFSLAAFYVAVKLLHRSGQLKILSSLCLL